MDEGARYKSISINRHTLGKDKSMKPITKSRIRQRIVDLGLNPKRVDDEAGFSTGFTRDLLTGRKKTIRANNLEKIAAVLQCDVNFLLGRDEDLGLTSREDRDLKYIGACSQAWLDDDADFIPPEGIPARPDPRYAAEDQGWYDIRDNHAASLGIPEDAIVVAYTDMANYAPRPGDIVVTKSQEGEKIRRTISKIFRSGREMLPLVDTNNYESEIEGIVLYVITIFP